MGDLTLRVPPPVLKNRHSKQGLGAQELYIISEVLTNNLLICIMKTYFSMCNMYIL